MLKHFRTVTAPSALLVTAVAAWCLVAVLTLGNLSVYAQTPSTNGAERISVEAGDVVELFATNKDPTVQYAWILTQDGNFMEAGRNQVFQTRLTLPGTYLLEAAAYTPDYQTQIRRSFSIEVRDRATGVPLNMDASTAIRTIPETSGDKIVLPRDVQVVYVDPGTRMLQAFTIDTDTTTDSDGDGSPNNDRDTNQALATTEGHPLYMWFTDLSVPVSVQATVMNQDGTTVTKQFTVTTDDRQVSQQSSSRSVSVINGNAIVVTQLSGGRTRFSVSDPAIQNARHVLTHWSFGDGMQSLITEPEHRYPKSGVYTVSLNVYDLENGSEILQGERQVTIELPAYVTPSSSSVASSTASSEEPTNEDPNTASSFWSTLRVGGSIVGILVLAVLVGAGIAWLVRRLLGGSGGLQKKLEEVESRFVDKKDGTAADIIDAVQPLQIRKQVKEDTDAPVVEKEPPLDPANAPEPTVDIDKAPAWLKKGLVADAKTVTPTVDETPVTPVIEEPTVVPPANPEPVAPVTPVEEPVAAVTEPTEDSDNFLDLMSSTSDQAAEPQTTVPTEDSTAPIVEDEAVATPVVTTEPPVAVEQVSTPAPTPVVAPAAAVVDQAKLDRERERKRLKRQRYRDNKRKREEEAKAKAPAATPAAPVQTTEPPPIAEPVTDTPVEQPVVIDEPAADDNFLDLMEQNPEPTVQEQVVTTVVESANPQPTAGVAPTVPEEPLPPQTPTSEPTKGQSQAAANDDSVAFLIQADSIDPNAK